MDDESLGPGRVSDNPDRHSFLTELGRIGLTAVGDAAEQAWELHQQAEPALLAEAEAAAADRPEVL